MDFIELESPTRRPELLERSDFRYTITDIQYLPHPATHQPVDVFDVLRRRVTRREFGPLPIEDLSSFLWYSLKSFHAHKIDESHTWLHKPVPSGGGRHPIDQLIFRIQDDRADVLLYDHVAHALARLKLTDGICGEFVAAVNEIVKVESATIIWNIAQVNKVTAVYKHASSLIYRDEGAIQATCGLVAESLDLSFCTLGISGEPYIGKMLDSDRKIVGVGGMLVGSRLGIN